jgi:3-oxoacyl-[acyl-carrier protein] reductase
MSNNSFEGMTALVTGGGSGLGYAISKALLELGARVAIHYHSSQAGAQHLLDLYGEAKCFLIQADFSDSDSSRSVFQGVIARYGVIDILVNNAAWIEAVEDIDRIDSNLMERSFRVNSIAPFILGKLALKGMQERKSGRIVSVSSIGVKYSGSNKTAHYMISKAALEAGTLALAKAAASDGVLINVVRAGMTRTGLHERLGRTDMSSREALIPLGRMAEPDEIAKTVIFLVSPLNTYITGCIIPVAGGE